MRVEKSFENEKRKFKFYLLLKLAHAQLKVKKVGGSLEAVIPRSTARELHLNEGEVIGVEIQRKKPLKLEKVNDFGIFKGGKVIS